MTSASFYLSGFLEEVCWWRTWCSCSV